MKFTRLIAITFINLFMLASIYSQTATRMEILDTRYDNTGPIGYSKEVKFEFKANGTIGVPGNSYYGGLMTIAPWGSNDNSGNKHHQLNFNDGGIYYRNGWPGNSNWDSWRKLVLEDQNGQVGIGTITPIYRLHVAGDVFADGGWLRSSGTTGWYNESFGGGFYMIDNLWIRTYGSKNFYQDAGIMRTDGIFQVGPNGNRFIVNASGQVGIGTTSPQYTLDVNGETRINGSLRMPTNYDILIGANHAIGTPRLIMHHWNNLHAYIDYKENLYFRADDPNVSALTLYGDGTVGVGFGTTYETGNYPTKSYKLAVNGAMVAEKIVVKLRANWPDFVFAENHKMRSLSEIESYIKEYRHLPDVPTAQEVNEKGIDVGEMNAILLKKIEEMTLILIEQNKRIEELEKK